MDNGYYERHISRMRRVYRIRRNRMMEVISGSSPYSEIRGEEAGLHFIVRFPIAEETMVRKARENGFVLSGTGTGWIVIGYAHLSDEQIDRFGLFLRKALE